MKTRRVFAALLFCSWIIAGATSSRIICKVKCGKWMESFFPPKERLSLWNLFRLCGVFFYFPETFVLQKSAFQALIHTRHSGCLTTGTKQLHSGKMGISYSLLTWQKFGILTPIWFNFDANLWYCWFFAEMELDTGGRIKRSTKCPFVFCKPLVSVPK